MDTQNVGGPLGTTRDFNFWDIAAFYTADWNSIKLSAAYAFTWIESGADTGQEVNLHQVGASIQHKPSGLGIYGMYQAELADGSQAAGLLPREATGLTPADGNCFDGLEFRLRRRRHRLC